MRSTVSLSLRSHGPCNRSPQRSLTGPSSDRTNPTSRCQPQSCQGSDLLHRLRNPWSLGKLALLIVRCRQSEPSSVPTCFYILSFSDPPRYYVLLFIKLLGPLTNGQEYMYERLNVDNAGTSREVVLYSTSTPCLWRPEKRGRLYSGLFSDFPTSESCLRCYSLTSCGESAWLKVKFAPIFSSFNTRFELSSQIAHAKMRFRLFETIHE